MGTARGRIRSAPALIGFYEGEKYKREKGKRVEWRGREYRLKTTACHDPILHLFEEPCILLIRKPPSTRTSAIVKIITHETIHHVLQDIFDADGMGSKEMSDYNKGLDKILDSLSLSHPLRRALC
jgi:hypothetical protein